MRRFFFVLNKNYLLSFRTKNRACISQIEPCHIVVFFKEKKNEKKKLNLYKIVICLFVQIKIYAFKFKHFDKISNFPCHLIIFFLLTFIYCIEIFQGCRIIIFEMICCKQTLFNCDKKKNLPKI